MQTTWMPSTETGVIHNRAELPESVFAFPRQRKEPLTDASHVRNAIARFDQVKDVTEDERLTDFATVFLGLGKLTLNGYHPIQWSVPRRDKVVTYTYQVGYLSAREIADVMCRVCAFRSIQLPDVQANLTDSARGHLAAAQDAEFRQRLFALGAEARPGNGEVLARTAREERDRWAGLVRRLNIQVQ